MNCFVYGNNICYVFDVVKRNILYSYLTFNELQHFYCHLDVDLDGSVHKPEFLKAYCSLPEGIFLYRAFSIYSIIFINEIIFIYLV